MIDPPLGLRNGSTVHVKVKRRAPVGLCRPKPFVAGRLRWRQGEHLSRGTQPIKPQVGELHDLKSVGLLAR